LPRYRSVYVQKATRRTEKWVNTLNTLRYFSTNKNFLTTGYVQARSMIFIVKCETVTLFFIAYTAL